MELPLHLLTAIDHELEKQSTHKIATLVTELSESYRTGIPLNKGKFIRSHEDVIAYASFRLPATFAAVYSSISHIKERYPQWNPKTLMDVGAGPGTAMWATSTLWTALEHITLLEQEEYMIDFGKRLSAYSPLTAVQKAEWIKTDITKQWDVSPHDLVIASYVLNELPQDKSEKFIKQLWDRTGDVLVIIEPGTPAGFLRIKKAREQLIATGAKTIAPCPHDLPCPMDNSDWCHFSQRVARSRLHRNVKAGELSYEDEKFSFLCMSRTGGKAIKGLVIRHPQVRKGHIQLKLCTPNGLTNSMITRKDKDLFKKSRDLTWGSIINNNDEL
ncbi:MAG: Ribosomal small subunit Rsm22 [Haloplasmataceae bacterium]|jgi:ribosomal protein RSM22 (predicted rRNA methylase)|nr:Ribosomal small subunit Rsm22 [Haloplasmataceae bacterium]